VSDDEALLAGGHVADGLDHLAADADAGGGDVLQIVEGQGCGPVDQALQVRGDQRGLLMELGQQAGPRGAVLAADVRFHLLAGLGGQLQRRLGA
jgi:hypothetical protein